jgi:hypothetical protein
MRHCVIHPSLHDRSQLNRQGPPAPRARFFEEPDAVVPHAGICEGASGNRRPYLNLKNEVYFPLLPIPHLG